MEHSIADTAEAAILVIEPSPSVRMMITEVLKSLGYQHIQGASSAKEALSMMEVEKIHWLITPLMANEPINAMQIIKLITTEPALFQTRVTLMVDLQTEIFCLPLAFELGLLSFQGKTYSKDIIHSDFQQLQRNIASHRGNLVLTAADYLRRHLTEQGLFASRVDLEQNLLGLYPGNPKVLYHMAEAEILLGNQERAWGLLAQAELIDEKLAPLCQHLRSKYAEDKEAETATFKENTLGIKQVVLIDPDTDVIFATTQLLNQLGINAVEAFDDGKNAYEWLKAKGQGTDLIIMEWRIPNLSGSMLIQRIRNAGLVNVPIIIASSLVKKEEKPILLEMGVDDVLEKPFDKAAFFKVVLWAIQQNKMPTENKSMILKFHRLLQSGQSVEAGKQLLAIKADPHTREGTKKGLEAEIAMAIGDYKKACELGIESLRVGGDSLLLLNLVGKALLKLNQFDKALKCFDRANTLCSLNIERLLNISEINLHLGRVETSKKALENASQLDPDSPQVLETRCKINIDQGNIAQAAEDMQKLDSILKIASYVNNRGVALARSSRPAEAIDLYSNALQCLDKRWGNLAAAVAYNLGLAHIRNGDPDSAVKTLKQINKSSNSAVHKKAVALLYRIDKSLKTGERMVLEGDDKEDALGDDRKGTGAILFEIEDAPSPIRGEMACHLVFYHVEAIDALALGMIVAVPKFLKRSVIVKENAAIKNTGT